MEALRFGPRRGGHVALVIGVLPSDAEGLRGRVSVLLRVLQCGAGRVQFPSQFSQRALDRPSAGDTCRLSHRPELLGHPQGVHEDRRPGSKTIGRGVSERPTAVCEGRVDDLIGRFHPLRH